jgi:uncharacterized protein YbaR (Trm112 family)/SAM-dependent methyltransferase
MGISSNFSFLGGITDKIAEKLQAQKRNRIIEKLIRPGELVLEVGCGNASVKQSTVLLDKFISPSPEHRSGQKPISQINGKPFILGDGNKLPFKNQSIGTIICRHVIEHIDDPAGFLMELQRVGKTGYLEWPSIFCELIRGGYGDQRKIRDLFPPELNEYLAGLEHGAGTKGHKWFIVPLNSTLYFVPKNKEQYPLYLLYGAYAKAAQNKKKLSRLLGDRVSWVTWSDNNSIDSVILQQMENNDVINSLNEQYSISDQMKFIEKMPCQHKNQMLFDDIKKALCCPVCKKGDLLMTQRNAGDFSLFFVCQLCNRKYPVLNEVPVLIDQATNLT